MTPRHPRHSGSEDTSQYHREEHHALDDLLDVLVLVLLGDLVLVDNQVSSLLESVSYDLVQLLVLQDIVDAFLAAVVAVVSSSGVASVDSEELTLNEGGEVLNEVNTLNLWWLRGKERLALNTPLVELLDLDVQTSVLVLHRNNTVNGAVGKASLVLNVRLGRV
ncbi:hypothetical protein KCU83_g128, partial [Aureobasidium melanogenum]